MQIGYCFTRPIEIAYVRPIFGQLVFYGIYLKRKYKNRKYKLFLIKFVNHK